MNDTTNCVKDGGKDERKRLRHDVRSDARKGNQQAFVKLPWSMVSVSSFNTLFIHCYYFTHTWGILRPYTKGTDEVGIKRGYSRDIVLFVQQLRRMLGFLKEYSRAAMDRLLLRFALRNDGRISRLGILTVFCVLFSFASVVEAQAQELRQGGATDQAAIKPLEIGDTIPEELWHLPLQVVNHPEGKETITLNDYRDKKLIILDFWATWCGNCIREFSQLEELKKEFKADGEFILSTVQGQEVQKLLKEKQITLSSIIQTRETLSKYFPHLFIPYYIWIGDGKVLATTQPEEVNKENIERYINRGLVPKRIRKDRMGFKLTDYFMNDTSIVKESVLKTSFVVSGIIENVKREANFYTAKLGVPSFYGITNTDIKGVYESIIGIDRPDLRNPHYFKYATKWENKIESAFSDYYDNDSINHIYSIQYFGFDKDKTTLREQVLNKFNGFVKEKYGINASIEKNLIAAYVIRSAETVPQNETNKDLTLIPLYQLINILDLQNHNMGIQIPWIDKTGNSLKVVSIPDVIPASLKDINHHLKTQGLIAKKEMILSDVFVIQDVTDIKY